MLRRTLVLVLAAAALAGSPLAAQDAPPEPDLNDPVTLRMNMMSQVGAAAKLAGAMVKGEAPFDARVAESVLRTIHGVALGYGGMFGEGTDFGHDTTAAPAIWEDREGFDEALTKFIADTRAAVQASPDDLDAFRAAFQQVAGNCKACHEDFRIRKE